MGWRYLLYTLGAVTLLVFILRFGVFRFQESPKFLVYRGQEEKAVAVLDYIAKFNGHENNITIASFEALTAEHDSLHSADSDRELLGTGSKQLHLSMTQKLKLEGARFGILFSNFQMARLTILVWLTYAMDYWGFTVAGTYLPRILAIKNGRLNLDLIFTYRSYIYIYLPGVVAVAIAGMFYKIPQVGRKWGMVISSALMGISIFLFSAVNDAASNIGLSLMEYFFQSMFNAILYGWTPEAFPAPIRGTACGVASFWGRLFGIVSPIIAQHLFGQNGGNNVNAVLYLAGGVTLGCVVTTALLPGKMIGRQSF